jgi:hypothetical protein
LVNERKSNCQTLEYGNYTETSPKLRILLLCANFGAPEKVANTRETVEKVKNNIASAP